MVCEWGMSDELGALTYGKKEEQIFLGREIGQNRDFSEDTAKEIDAAVRKIIENAMTTVTNLLDGHRDVLTLMAEELLEKETIVLSDIERMVEKLYPGKYSDLMKKAEPAKPKPEPQPETKSEPEPEKNAETPDDEVIIEVKEESGESAEKDEPAVDPKPEEPKEQ